VHGLEAGSAREAHVSTAEATTLARALATEEALRREAVSAALQGADAQLAQAHARVAEDAETAIGEVRSAAVRAIRQCEAKNARQEAQLRALGDTTRRLTHSLQQALDDARAAEEGQERALRALEARLRQCEEERAQAVGACGPARTSSSGEEAALVHSLLARSLAEAEAEAAYWRRVAAEATSAAPAGLGHRGGDETSCSPPGGSASAPRSDERPPSQHGDSPLSPPPPFAVGGSLGQPYAHCRANATSRSSATSSQAGSVSSQGEGGGVGLALQPSCYPAPQPFVPSSPGATANNLRRFARVSTRIVDEHYGDEGARGALEDAHFMAQDACALAARAAHALRVVDALWSQARVDGAHRVRAPSCALTRAPPRAWPPWACARRFQPCGNPPSERASRQPPASCVRCVLSIRRVCSTAL